VPVVHADGLVRYFERNRLIQASVPIENAALGAAVDFIERPLVLSAWRL
jgi:hypothetical protein